jgi:hypothetical protein
MLHMPALALALLGLVLQGAEVDAQERPKVEIVPLIAHARDVSSAAFSRNGAHVLTGSEDGTLKLWDIETRSRRTVPVRCRAARTKRSGSGRLPLDG